MPGPTFHPAALRRISLFAAFAAACSLAAPTVNADGTPKVRVTVTVVGPDGKPVPAAPVFLMTPYTGDTAAVEAKTDDRGRVSFDAPRALMVAPSATLGIGAGIFTGKGETPVVRLAPAGTVSGRIVDTAGKPVPGGGVRPEYLIFESDEGEAGGVNYLPLPSVLAQRLKTVSRSDGGFTIAGMPLRPGSLLASLHDERFASSQIKLPLQNPTPDKSPEPLIAKPGAILKGRVLDVATGKPAAGVRVMAQGVGTQNGGSAADTDANGAYALIGLPEGQFNITATDPGGERVARALQNVKATPGRATPLADLRLTPGGFVVGRLVDAETGQPIGKGQVGVHGPHRPESSAMVDFAPVAADGTYRIRIPAGTSKVYLMDRPQEYFYEQKLLPVTIAEGETGTVDFTLKKGLVVEGVLVDESGNPVPHKNIVVSQGYQHQVYAATDEKGRFTATGLPPGEVRFAAHSFRNDFTLSGTVTAVLPTETPVRLVVRKPDPAARLTGRVVDSQGQPVPGAQVKVMVLVMTGDFGTGSHLPVVESGADGRFSTEPVVPGGTIQSVKVTKPGYAFRSGGVVSPAGGPPTLTDVVLTRLSGVVSGTTLDTKGRPLPGARVLSLSGGGTGADTVTDSAGRFTLKDLPEGEVSLLAGRDGAGIARAAAAPGAGPPRLTLSPIPRPETGKTGDIERAAALAEEALRDPASGNFYARNWVPLSFAAYAPERAKALSEKYRAGSSSLISGAIRPRSAGSEGPSQQQLAEWTPAKLAAIADVHTRITTALYAARTLAPLNPAAARQLYRQARFESNEFLKTDGVPWRRAFLYADLAAASALLGEPDQARRDVTAALEAAEAMKTPNEADGFRAAIAESLAEKGNPSLAEPILSRIAKDNRGSAYLRVISASAVQSPASAQRLLERAESEGVFADGGGDYLHSMAQRHLAAGLAAREPERALAVARRIGERSQRATALAAVAAKLTRARAAAIYREAAAALSGNRNAAEILGRAGRTALTADPALGRELLAKAREYAEELRRAAPEDTDSYEGILSWAFYAAEANPVASRMAVEREWAVSQGDPDVSRNPRRLLRIALAMAPVDSERAIELARKVPADGARLDALRKLAQYLAAPPAIRRTIPLDRWAASDTWTPGTPTGW